MKRTAAAAVLVAFLSGCGQLGYIASEYDNGPEKFAHEGRVFEITPHESRPLLLVSVFEFSQGLKADAEPIIYTPAVEQWLAENRGGCEILERREVLVPTWEYSFKCDLSQGRPK